MKECVCACVCVCVCCLDDSSSCMQLLCFASALSSISIENTFSLSPPPPPENCSILPNHAWWRVLVWVWVWCGNICRCLLERLLFLSIRLLFLYIHPCIHLHKESSLYNWVIKRPLSPTTLFLPCHIDCHFSAKSITLFDFLWQK